MKTHEKVILDATCGTRSIWFDKQCANAVFFDRREGECARRLGAKRYERDMYVEPDVVGDFTQMPFPDESFWHVVFDPPHVHLNETAWMSKMYGSLDANWETQIRNGFLECMRVLKLYGTLVFKWSDIEISTREVINAIGCEPLYGHRSGKKMNTHWMVFVKGVSDVQKEK